MKELFLLLKNKLLEDDNVISGNEIQVVESDYNGKQTISVGATNTFTYSIKDLYQKKSILYFH